MDHPITPPKGFHPPDWDAPVDLAAQLLIVPPGKSVRGFVIAGMAQRFRERGLEIPGTRELVGFKSYPFAQLLHASMDGARLLDPKHLRRGMREAGRMAFPATLDTMVGKVVFGALGKDAAAVFKAAGKAYEMVGTGSARAVSVGPRHAHIDLQGLYAFPESYHVGVCEGVVLACGGLPDVMIKQAGPTEVELFCRW